MGIRSERKQGKGGVKKKKKKMKNEEKTKIKKEVRMKMYGGELTSITLPCMLLVPHPSIPHKKEAPK